MSDFVIQLTEEELNRKVNFTKNSLSLDFDNHSFKKGPTFSLRMREQALKYCQKIMTKELKSLIVEGQYSLTVWIQEQIVSSQNENQAAKNDSSQVGQIIPESKSQSTPVSENNSVREANTKKVIRRYRGQTYEVEVPDYAAMQQKLQNQPKPRRKYRGQYID